LLSAPTFADLEPLDTFGNITIQPIVYRVGLAVAMKPRARDSGSWGAIGNCENRGGTLAQIWLVSVVAHLQQLLALNVGEQDSSLYH
jgi:hypothetical protein